MPKLTAAPYFSLPARDVDRYNFSAGAGTLNSMRFFNGTGSTVYLLLYDMLNVPETDEESVVPPIPVPAGGYYESSAPLGFATGGWLAVSSNDDVLAFAGTAGVLSGVRMAFTGERH
jgi:hypothetical protein